MYAILKILYNEKTHYFENRYKNKIIFFQLRIDYHLKSNTHEKS